MVEEHTDPGRTVLDNLLFLASRGGMTPGKLRRCTALLELMAHRLGLEQPFDEGGLAFALGHLVETIVRQARATALDTPTPRDDDWQAPCFTIAAVGELLHVAPGEAAFDEIRRRKIPSDTQWRRISSAKHHQSDKRRWQLRAAIWRGYEGYRMALIHEADWLSELEASIRRELLSADRRDQLRYLRECQRVDVREMRVKLMLHHSVYSGQLAEEIFPGLANILALSRGRKCESGQSGGRDAFDRQSQTHSFIRRHAGWRRVERRAEL